MLFCVSVVSVSLDGEGSTVHPVRSSQRIRLLQPVASVALSVTKAAVPPQCSIARESCDRESEVPPLKVASLSFVSLIIQCQIEFVSPSLDRYRASNILTLVIVQCHDLLKDALVECSVVQQQVHRPTTFDHRLYLPRDQSEHA